MSTSEPSIIDAKKNATQSQSENNTGNQILTYTKSIIYAIIILLLIICIGTSILYSCKVAQSNILPTDLLCNPYNNTSFMIPDIKEININVTNINETQQSEKIKFLYENNNKNIILDTLQKMSKNLKVKPIIMYFITILENLLCFIYNSLNVYLNFLNTSVSESLIIFGTPFITLMYLSFIYLLSWGYLIILFFTKMFWIFRINTNNSSKDVNKTDYFKQVSLFSSNGIISIIIAMILLSFIVVFITVIFPVLVFVSLIYCFLSTVTMTSTRVIGGTDYNYINALTDVFYYKKSLISYIIAYIVISKAFNIFGNNGGIISLIIVLLIYFKILKIPLFNSPELDPSKFGDLSDYIMAEKSCGPMSTLNNNRPTKIKKVKKNNVVVQETDTPEIIPENNTEINPENNTEIQENDLTNSESSNVELFPITGNISNVESENIPKIETISVEPQIEPIVETQPQIEPIVETQTQIEPIVETQPQIEPIVETQPQIEPISVEPQIEPIVETQPQIEPIVETQPQIEPISVEPQIEPDTTSKIEPTSVETARVLPNSLI
jgi:hypothetical protein